jgi:hypothetical protein
VAAAAALPSIQAAVPTARVLVGQSTHFDALEQLFDELDVREVVALVVGLEALGDDVVAERQFVVDDLLELLLQVLLHDQARLLHAPRRALQGHDALHKPACCTVRACV